MQFPFLLCPRESAVAKISTRQCLCGLSWPLFVSRVQVGDIKNLSPHLQSGPCQRNPLRKGSPHKKQDFPENESNQFLISRALVVQFPLLLCPKESAVARFPKTHCLCWPPFVSKVSIILRWPMLPCAQLWPPFWKVLLLRRKQLRIIGSASNTFAIRFCNLLTLRSLLSCSQGLVRRTLYVREAPTRSRTSQKMKAASSLSAELLLCNFLSCFALKSQLLQGFQKRIASAGHLLSPKSPMWLAVAPVLKGFTASEKAAAHYWQCFEPFAIRFCSLVTLRSLLSCSQGLVRRTLCVREAPTRSRTSQKIKATSSLSAELLLCNFRSFFGKRISCCQDFQNAVPLLATFRRQSLQKFEMAGADQIQDPTATESNTSFSQESF